MWVLRIKNFGFDWAWATCVGELPSWFYRVLLGSSETFLRPDGSRASGAFGVPVPTVGCVLRCDFRPLFLFFSDPFAIVDYFALVWSGLGWPADSVFSGSFSSGVPAAADFFGDQSLTGIFSGKLFSLPLEVGSPPVELGP